jgi:hypothetical protein
MREIGRRFKAGRSVFSGRVTSAASLTVTIPNLSSKCDYEFRTTHDVTSIPGSNVLVLPNGATTNTGCHIYSGSQAGANIAGLLLVIGSGAFPAATGLLRRRQNGASQWEAKQWDGQSLLTLGSTLVDFTSLSVSFIFYNGAAQLDVYEYA